MDDHLETWVSTVASQLDLPARQAAVVIEELRAHLQADFADRVRGGISEDGAIRATLAEMGDPESVAAGLNRVHASERSVLRIVLGILLTLLGYSGIVFAETGGLAQILYGFARVARRSDWYAWPDAASRWVTADELGRSAVILLPVFGVAFVVGYVARRRGWACALAPIGLLLGARVLEAAFTPRATLLIADLASLAAAVAVPLAGAYLGMRLARSRAPVRLPLFGIGAGLAAVIPVYGWIGLTIAPLSATASVTVASILALAFALNAGVWTSVLLVRRMHRAGA